ncbi:MAG TPA: hypothetical protein VFO17_00275 [Acidimicrobiia bacterium]|jgi:hypothetical protein|nr:hypothetical protein [Acidimicrobiia bacterium]
MSGGNTSPPRNVVLIRSIFVGLGAGGFIGMLYAALVMALSMAEGNGSMGDLIGALWVGFLLGGVIGLLTGAILGFGLSLIGPEHGSSAPMRLGVSLACMACGFAALAWISGSPFLPLDALIILVPAGVMAWFLLPYVLGPRP